MYKPFLLSFERKGYLEKINNLPKHHGAGPPAARGPMQLHPLKAGPAKDNAVLHKLYRSVVTKRE